MLSVLPDFMTLLIGIQSTVLGVHGLHLQNHGETHDWDQTAIGGAEKHDYIT